MRKLKYEEFKQPNIKQLISVITNHVVWVLHGY